MFVMCCAALGVHPEWPALCRWEEGTAHGPQQVLWWSQCLSVTVGRGVYVHMYVGGPQQWVMVCNGRFYSVADVKIV